MNDDVVSGGHCALTNMLADQVEVVPTNTIQNLSAKNESIIHFMADLSSVFYLILL